MRNRTYFGTLVLVLGFLYWTVFGAVFGAERSRRQEDTRLLDSYLSRQHPDGKGPSSTSSARGYYKGTGGRWYRR